MTQEAISDAEQEECPDFFYCTKRTGKEGQTDRWVGFWGKMRTPEGIKCGFPCVEKMGWPEIILWLPSEVYRPLDTPEVKIFMLAVNTSFIHARESQREGLK